MRFLRTNTAIRLTVGPFMDATNGVTPEIALTVTNCRLTLMVDDGNVPTKVLDDPATASGGNNDMIHVSGDTAGFYDLELTAGQLAFVGRAMLAITDAATHCPVFHEFMILPTVVYDSFVLGTDIFQTDVTQFGGTSGTFSGGRPEVNASHWGGTAVGSANVLIDGAVTAAKIAPGAIDADALAADAVAAIADAVLDEALAGHAAAGTFGEVLNDLRASYLRGLTTSGSTTTAILLNAMTGINSAAPSGVDDFYKGAVVIVKDGALAGQRTYCYGSLASPPTLKVLPMTTGLASGVAIELS